MAKTSLFFAACFAVLGLALSVQVFNLEHEDRIPGSYIVKFCDKVNDEQLSSLFSIAGASTLHHHYHRKNSANIRGVSDAHLAQIQESPLVCEIAADFRVYKSLAWGIDRIDQADLPLDSSYTPDQTGAGVDIWVFDTGLQTTHPEFSNSGRTVQNMYDYYGDTPSSPDADNDVDGHGTHTAGTAGGQNVGVAPGANIYGVKVLDDTGSGSFSDIIDALELVQTYYSGDSSPDAVVSMSLGAYCQTGCSMESYFTALVDAGIVGVVASGNDASDACNYVPAQYSSLITVGATTSSDVYASYSNYGSCDDILAPGSSVYSSIPGSSYATYSGTSMATPHVAGVAALYLEDDTTLTPDGLLARMLGDSQVSTITSVTNTNTPNKFLQVPGSGSSYPGTVDNLQLNSRTKTSLDVKWTAPTAGSTPVSYTLQYRKLSATTYRVISSIKTMLDSTYYRRKFTGLTCGTTYEVQVRAVNTIGSGSWVSIDLTTMSC